MQGVQNFTIVSRDMLHTVLAEGYYKMFWTYLSNGVAIATLNTRKLNYSANEVNILNFTKYMNTIMSENCMNKTVQI